jgi:ATP-binding cassette subfamily B protein
MTEGHLEKEEILGKPFEWQLFLRLAHFAAPYSTYLILSLALLFLYAAVRIAQPYLVKIAIDNHVAHGDLPGLDRIALIYLGLAAVGFFFRYTQTMAMQIAGQRAMHDLRIALFSRLQFQDAAFFDRRPVGQIMTRVINDIETVTELLTSGIVALLGDVLILAGIAIAMILLDWRLALVALSTFPLLVYSTGFYRRKSRDNYRENRVVLGELNAHLQESIAGITTIQTFSQEQRNFNRFLSLNTMNRENLLKGIHFNSVFYPLVELFSACSIGLSLWYGTSLILQGLLLKGVVIAFIQYIERIFAPIRDLAEKYAIVQSAMASGERIFSLLDEPIRIQPPVIPVRANRVNGSIEFRDAYMSYFHGDAVLKGVSFSIRPGERLAIVGPTGSGKTSLVSALLRFYDLDSGEILVDGINIKDWDLTELRRAISLVPQDLFLFSGTVSENISLRDPTVSDERVRFVSKEVNAQSFIQDLPRGYEEPVMERGSTLSQGQRQLLCFARALAFDSRVLVLDEATSSIDPETEGLIQEALARLLENRTALIIAHRLATVEFADRILVLHSGRIKEEGSHRTLLANPSSLYARLYHLQQGTGIQTGHQK